MTRQAIVSTSPQPAIEREKALILVVEDNALNAKLTKEMLTAAGYAVILARDGHEGLRYARQRKPALVITDLQMPGIDGLELTHRLKADSATSHIPIIALTAHARPEHRKQVLDAGCLSFITKPFRYQALIAEVSCILQSSLEGAH